MDAGIDALIDEAYRRGWGQHHIDSGDAMRLDRIRRMLTGALSDDAQDLLGRHALHRQIFALRDMLKRLGSIDEVLDRVVGPAPECTSCHGTGEPPTERLDASAYGLGLPGAKPRHIAESLDEGMTGL